MSVFTKVSYSELKSFLRQYPLGEVVGFQGIGEGVENTNYFVDTTDGRWVLTLFERLDPKELPYFLDLMEHLARRGLPCPMPLRTLEGRALTQLNGKPAALTARLTGQSVLSPEPAQCAAAGRLLAELHRAGSDFEEYRRNCRGPEWRAATACELVPVVDRDTAALIEDELAAQEALDLTVLPQSVIHADLFRDNVLFIAARLSGVIDFYYACNDALLYDLAVTANDWCFDLHGQPVAGRWRALAGAYCAQRAPDAAERAAWPLTLRAAALRFWLSRLYDWHFPRGGDVVHVKDPAPYRRILERHRAGNPFPL